MGLSKDKKCCVPNCNKTRLDNIILHTFPKPDKERSRFNNWLYAIGGDILGLENEAIHKSYRVCHIHFETKYYTSSKRLHALAVPTLHLPGISNVREPMRNIINISAEEPTCTITMAAQQPTTSTFTQETSTAVSTSKPTLKGICNVREPMRNITNIYAEEPTCTSTVTAQEPTTSIFTQIGLPGTSTAVSTCKPTLKVKPVFVNKQYNEIITLKKDIRKLQKAKDTYAIRLKKAMKLSKNITFQKVMSRFTSTASLFLNLQFREIKKDKMGRRFTKEEKIMALTLYKKGPKAYRFLRKMFVLPAPVTLSRMISMAGIGPGLNENIFKELEGRVREMSYQDTLCILLFDEISLSPHFDYNNKKDLITGFVNNGEIIQKKIANHALVFMIRGIQKNYKQPIMYTFCSGSTPKYELAIQIKKIINKLSEIGITVIATVCDQAASNVSAINYLVEETKRKYVHKKELFNKYVFEIDDKEVVPLYDPPHLIKGIRNNLLKGNLICEIDSELKRAKWEDIIMFYEENPNYKGIRLIPKLTESHVYPDKLKKMKVKCATQVFSKTVGINMGFLADKGILHASCKDTADVILFFDELFDSVNGSYTAYNKKTLKPLLGPCKPNSPHIEVWTSSKKVLKSMKFIHKGKSVVVPSIKNWQHTIENLEIIIKKLHVEHNLTSIWIRHFNQDPLENFFSCIRSHGYRNINPTCAGFETAFSSLLINNLSTIHSPGANCEIDSCKPMTSMTKMFFENKEVLSCAPITIDFEYINNDHIFEGLENKKKNPIIMAQLEYVAGYILKNIKSRIFKNCNVCRNDLFDNESKSEYLKLREIRRDKKLLVYPAHSMLEMFSDIQDVVTSVIKSKSNEINLKNYIKTVLSVVTNFNAITCNEHKLEIMKYMPNLACNFFIYNWCKTTNKILKGTRSDFDSDDILQKMARQFYLKRKK